MTPTTATPSPDHDQPPLPFKLPKVTAADRRRADRLLEALRRHYPHAHCELVHASAHELLIATILSAQSTDVGVNKATPALFKAFPTPADYARATPEQIEPFIRTIGLFRNKARAIHAAMKDIQDRFNGQVPRTMEELLTLRGVGRKTAGVVLGNAFKINVGVVVDTHVERLSHRFGLVPTKTPVPRLEQKLMALFPRDAWCDLSHLLIFHGRYTCKARVPGGQCSNHEICRTFGTSCELRINGKDVSAKRSKKAKKPTHRAT